MGGEDVTVREASEADVPTWAALRHKLWPDQDPEELSREAREFFQGATPTVAVVFVAEARGAPAGFAEVSVRSYVEGASSLPAPFLEGWYVEPGHRGRGVGRALVAAAESWARANGYGDLGSDVELDNEGSAAAHEALGFVEVERLRVYLKRL